MLQAAEQHRLDFPTPATATSREDWAERLRAAGIHPPQRYTVEANDFAKPIRTRRRVLAFLIRTFRRIR